MKGFARWHGGFFRLWLLLSVFFVSFVRLKTAWDASRIGVCVSGRARREMHFASGHGFQGVPAVRRILLWGVCFWVRPA